MTRKEGTLRLQPSDRWAIICPGRSPVAIVESEVFELEVAGKMKLAPMERRRRPDGTDEWVTARQSGRRRGPDVCETIELCELPREDMAA
jgi:hypothetical protein